MSHHAMKKRLIKAVFTEKKRKEKKRKNFLKLNVVYYIKLILFLVTQHLDCNNLLSSLPQYLISTFPVTLLLIIDLSALSDKFPTDCYMDSVLVYSGLWS